LVGGVWEVLPPIEDAIAAVLTTTELSSLISGCASFDVADWQAHSVFRDFADSPLPLWLAEILHRASAEFRGRLLCFVTGSTNIPLGGFQLLTPPFTVQARSELSDDHLPAARTCFNCL
jgi:hypothetical protein